jgi:hypothetical protein
MSIRSEQYRALKQTQELLRDISDMHKTPRVPKEVRQRAIRCLRHYPYFLADETPLFSKH